jgi:hypothetical protein
VSTFSNQKQQGKHKPRVHKKKLRQSELFNHHLPQIIMSSNVLLTPENKRISVSLTSCPPPPQARRSLVLLGNGEVKKFPALPLYTRRNGDSRALRPRPIYGSIMLAQVSSTSLMDEEQSDEEARPAEMPLLEKGHSVAQTLQGLCIGALLRHFLF